MPIKPLPDSLIYRTTLKQLESQTVTLKRLSKTVLSNLATVSGIYDQLDSAEDELMGSLGELSRWLGHGYGLQPGVWDEDRGVREVRREKRKRQKEDLEVMVHQSVENVRGELKRRGLAGGGATAKYEVSTPGRLDHPLSGVVNMMLMMCRKHNKDIIARRALISHRPRPTFPRASPPIPCTSTATPRYRPPIKLKWHVQPKLMPCHINIIQHYYTPPHQARWYVWTYSSAYIHGPVPSSRKLVSHTRHTQSTQIRLVQPRRHLAYPPA